MNTWTKDLPTEPGLYWWTDGKQEPVAYRVSKSFFSEKTIFFKIGSGERNVYTWPGRGLWQKVEPPKMP